jgi:hypothetical protein
MPPSLPEIDDVQQGADLLAARCMLARQLHDPVKEADWRDTVNQHVNRLTTASPDLAAAFGPTGGGSSQYWGDVGWESLRNALIGAGVGGVGGAASSLLSKRRRKRPLSSILRGALLGAGVGAGGTAMYRGGRYGLSSIPSDDAANRAKELAAREAMATEKARHAAAARSPGLHNLLPALKAPASTEPKRKVPGEPIVEDVVNSPTINRLADISEEIHGTDVNPYGMTALTVGGAMMPKFISNRIRTWNAVRDLAKSRELSKILPEGTTELPAGYLAGRSIGGEPLKAKDTPANVLEATRKHELIHPWKRLTPWGRVPGLSGSQMIESAKLTKPGRGWKGKTLPAALSALGFQYAGPRLWRWLEGARQP